MFQFPIKSDQGGGGGGQNVKSTKLCQQLYYRVCQFILLGALIYKMICCWVPYFYTQGFTFIITETACMLNAGLKNKL